MKYEITTKSSEETERLAEKLAQSFKGGEVVMMSSDLGGGKTTFVRGLVRGLGSSDHVSSPTFTVSQTYQGDKFRILHIDMYRLSVIPNLIGNPVKEESIITGLRVGARNDNAGAGDDSSDLLLLEDDGIGDPDTVTVIEWASPEMFAHHPDALKIEIKKSNEDENYRQLVFEENRV
jgi:tRNA A37 threonylcarbamoyladenosine biosynthesis protein TsaE